MLKLVGTDSGEVLRAEASEKITKADWETIAPAIDHQLEKFDKLRLLLDARHFEGWENLEAARAHFDFVKARHRQVSRVAIVTGRQWHFWVSAMAAQFVDAEVRAFGPADYEAAEQWLRDETIQRGIAVQWDSDRQLLTIEAMGKVTGTDFRSVLTPVMEDAVAEGGSVNLVVDVSRWTGLNLEALWEDLKFSFTHLRHIGRAALVGDQRWLEWLGKMAGPVVPAKVRAFASDQREQARDWACGQ